MEENAPFDGIMFDLVATSPEGKQCASQVLFTEDAWEREWFLPCVKNLESCDFQRYRDNFIRIDFYPTPFDWSNDDCWSKVCEKAGICAWVARETNSNICFDFESYGAQMFHHDPKTGRTFAESKALARKRGAEMTAAIVKEKPDAVILCLWMNSINFPAGRADNPDSVLKGFSYGLLPSFIDGMLDAVGPETVLVDGCENGYYMNGAAEYDRAACDMFLATGPAVALVSPENRAKYRAQTQVGFGFYLDMYSNPEGSQYYRGPEPGETRFDRLAANLRAALNASDQYVWVYGEQKRWWAPENPEKEWTSWEEALPGVTELIFELSDLKAALQKQKERVLNDPDKKNLIANGDFANVDANGRPADWGTWQIETSPTGTFVAEDGGAALKNMTNGCYIGSIPAEPGETYFVLAKARIQGESAGGIRVRWNDEKGAWTKVDEDVIVGFDPEAEPDANGDREVFAKAIVPDGAHRLVLLLSASGAGNDGTVIFDDVKVYKASK